MTPSLEMLTLDLTQLQTIVACIAGALAAAFVLKIGEDQ